MSLDLTNVLVLVPHRDDECLGLGGTLPQCYDLHMHYFNTTHPNVHQDQYDDEAEAVRDYLECSVSYTSYPDVNRLAEYPIDYYITEIEHWINALRPHTVFVPFPSYNQDHKVVYNAAITALRVHDLNWFVPNVYLYEQPETHTPAYTEFNPQAFVRIDIEEKLYMYRLYQSQVRGHRSLEHVEALARMRGMQFHTDYAESFQIVRIG